MTFSEKLLKMRKERGMSQEALAEQLNTTRQAVSKWENGQGFPETEKILMIGNIFNVSIDYLLKEESEFTDGENEQGYYASREVVAGYIISEKKRAKLPASGVFIMIASCIIPNVFLEQESIANAIMLCLIAVGVSLLAVFVFQLIFRTDKYKALRNEPLVFDNNFLKEFKENYRVLIKKYVGMMVFSLAIIFSGIILANMANGNWVDGVFLFLIAMAVYIMIYAGYMMIVHNVIVNNDKRT
ncbi:hypothetical protein FACS18947_4670 [Bacteroidia bacterium]|nr:hypothetical protein FACS18947_4670 [Bacteroidia bacterium]